MGIAYRFESNVVLPGGASVCQCMPPSQQSVQLSRPHWWLFHLQATSLYAVEHLAAGQRIENARFFSRGFFSSLSSILHSDLLSSSFIFSSPVKATPHAADRQSGDAPR